MSYTALVHGATCVLYHCYYRPRALASWNMIGQVGREMWALKGCILKRTPDERVQVVPDQSGVRALLKTDGSKWYLITVNVSDENQEVELVLPRQLGFVSASRLFETGADKKLKEGYRLQAGYDPLERKVFRLGVKEP